MQRYKIKLPSHEQLVYRHDNGEWVTWLEVIELIDKYEKRIEELSKIIHHPEYCQEDIVAKDKKIEYLNIRYEILRATCDEVASKNMALRERCAVKDRTIKWLTSELHRVQEYLSYALLHDLNYMARFDFK